MLVSVVMLTSIYDTVSYLFQSDAPFYLKHLRQSDVLSDRQGERQMANFSMATVAATGRDKAQGVSTLMLLTRKQREIMAAHWAKLAAAAIRRRVGRG